MPVGPKHRALAGEPIYFEADWPEVSKESTSKGRFSTRLDGTVDDGLHAPAQFVRLREVDGVEALELAYVATAFRW